LRPKRLEILGRFWGVLPDRHIGELPGAWIAYGGTGRVRVKIRQIVYTNLKGETMEKDVMNYNGFITS
jgi:hypothetical protein